MGAAPSVVLQFFGPHAPLSFIFVRMGTWLAVHAPEGAHSSKCTVRGRHVSRTIFVGWMAQWQKNYGIIGEIRIQRKKITVSPPAGQCIENGFGWLRPISLMFFWGATVHILLYRRWPLKSILHSLFYGISTGCLKYHANARVSSIGFG